MIRVYAGGVSLCKSFFLYFGRLPDDIVSALCPEKQIIDKTMGMT